MNNIGQNLFKSFLDSVRKLVGNKAAEDPNAIDLLRATAGMICELHTNPLRTEVETSIHSPDPSTKTRDSEAKILNPFPFKLAQILIDSDETLLNVRSKESIQIKNLRTIIEEQTSLNLNQCRDLDLDDTKLTQFSQAERKGIVQSLGTECDKILGHFFPDEEISLNLFTKTEIESLTLVGLCDLAVKKIFKALNDDQKFELTAQLCTTMWLSVNGLASSKTPEITNDDDYKTIGFNKRNLDPDDFAKGMREYFGTLITNPSEIMNRYTNVFDLALAIKDKITNIYA